MRRKLDSILEVTVICLLSLMVLDILWQVLARYVLGNPSSFSDELAGYLLIWTGLFGAALASGRHLHLAIDLFPNSRNGVSAKVAETFVYACMALFSLSILIIGGSRLIYMTWILEQRSAAMNLPLALVYAAIPMSGLCLLTYALLDIKGVWTQKEATP